MKIGDYLIAKDDISRTIYLTRIDNLSGKILSVLEKHKMIFSKNEKYIVTDINNNIVTISYGINDRVKFSLINDSNNLYEYYKNIFFDTRFLKLNKLNKIIF
jgi:hypothetical protein